MNTGEKIGYMIACLQVAKAEYEYSVKYKAECPSIELGLEWYLDYINRNRKPNMTLIRENIRNVSRMGFQIAKDIGK